MLFYTAAFQVHGEDGILECWKKNMMSLMEIVPLLMWVSVDSFEEPCFVVEFNHDL